MAQIGCTPVTNIFLAVNSRWLYWYAKLPKQLRRPMAAFGSWINGGTVKRGRKLKKIRKQPSEETTYCFFFILPSCSINPRSNRSLKDTSLPRTWKSEQTLKMYGYWDPSRTSREPSLSPNNATAEKIPWRTNNWAISWSNVNKYSH